MTSAILQFAADHPWTAVFLSLPTFLTCAVWAWFIACIVEGVINLVARLANIVAILVRGYPPVALAEVEPDDDDETS